MVPEVSGSLRWARGQGRATLAESDERRLFGRQRRANADMRRDRRYTVKVNAVEDAALRARAGAAGVTVPRLMFESALDAHIVTNTQRAEVVAEVFAVRRLMATVANNVNQLARYANTEGVFPAEADAVVAE